MKSAALVMIKIALPILFLWNIGLFTWMSHVDSGPSAPMKADEGKGDRQFLQEKVNRATKLGKDYTPELYFKDLAEIELKKKHNDFDRMAVIGIFSATNEIFAVFFNNVKTAESNLDKISYAKFMNRVDASREKFKEAINPGTLARQADAEAQAKDPNYWTNILLGILSFLGTFYLKNFPLAFVLLWIWWYQDKDKVRISNPFSFLTCLLLYPITVLKVWRKITIAGLDEFAMTIELKRRKVDIFSLFSDDEISEINKFAKSNLKLKDYRLHLDNRGLIRRHALVPVVVIVLLLLIIPKSFALPLPHKSVDVVKYQTEIKVPPDISGTHGSYHDNVVASAITYQDQVFIHFNFIWRRVFMPIAKQHLGFRTNPDPVPLFN